MDAIRITIMATPSRYAVHAARNIDSYHATRLGISIMSTLLSVALCLSPVLLVWIGYLWGRYGFPVEIRRRQKADRRSRQIEDSVPDAPVVDYQYEN